MQEGKRTEKADFTEKQEIKQMIDVLWYRNAPEYRRIAEDIKTAWRKYSGRDEQGATN